MSALPVFDPMSPQARAIADLFNHLLIISAVIMAVVAGLVLYSLIRFRARPDAPEPRQSVGNKRIEAVWTITPFLLLVWIFYMTAQAMNRSDPLPRNQDPDLVVTGHQWWWEVKYPKTGVVTANELHIPTGRPLLVQMESADVIHNFWAPQLARKTDVVPGHPNQIWMQSNKTGTYMGWCAEYCGTQHAWMLFKVIAEPAAEFEAWQQKQLQPASVPVSPAAERGARVFQQKTCANCHVVAGIPGSAQAGPNLTHLASRQTLAAGVLKNTPDNLAKWMADPQAYKPGSLMPKVQMTTEEMADLLAYLETLK